MKRKEHWEGVYSNKNEAELSWTQPDPGISISLIGKVCPSGGRVIDVGGGDSVLAERLTDAGYSVAVLDLSSVALRRAAARMGERAEKVQWIEGDVTASPDLGEFDVWHDRAVFHFFTEAPSRAAYVALMKHTIPMGGYAILATFARDGPSKCSGLEVRRYDSASLAVEVGAQFELCETVPHTHLTPWGKPQSFQYSVFRRA